MSNMAYYAMRRDAISSIESVPSTFSSWDNCMSKAYCKWPVIAAIVIGGLIVLSIVWCLARCLCCGASCCCSCLRCLDCFTPNRHGRQRDSQNKDDYRPMPNQGFQPMPSPMVYNQPPQFATFETPSGGKIHEDSLPAMPSWDTATKRRVEDPDAAQAHGEDVEMGRLDQLQRPGRTGYAQVPNGAVDPAHSPYGNYGQSQDYFDAAGASPQPYGSDLDAQRLGQQQGPQRNQSYSSGFQNAPLSPAPTYATHAPENQNFVGASGDRFPAGAVAPTPEQYNNRAYTHSPPQSNGFAQTGQGNYNRQYAPTASTKYEPSGYSSQYVSPTQRNAPQSFGYGHDNGYQNNNATSPTGQYRPPSLLQTGRKPVSGSYREV